MEAAVAWIVVRGAFRGEAVVAGEYSPSEVAGLLRRLGADRVLILGPPGIGKSTVLREYAAWRAGELGLRLVDLSRVEEPSAVDPGRDYLFLHVYAPLVRPEDLAFIARAPWGGYDWMLPWRLRLLASRGVHGLLFIDELTNAGMPEVQTMLYSLVLDKRVAFQSLSEGVEVAAAGNEPRDSPVAVEPPPPLLDRFRLLLRMKPPSPWEWAAWMARQGKPWDERVAAALAARPDLMYRPPRAGELEKFPTPRGWSVLAWELARTGRPAGGEAVALAEAIVGPQAAVEVAAFLGARSPGDPLEALRRARTGEELLLAVATLGSRLHGSDPGSGEACRAVEEAARRGDHLAVLLAYTAGWDPVEASAKCPALRRVMERAALHL